MRISLEFDSAQDLFQQLPRFAALIGFSGQFAEFTQKPRSEGTELDEPDLPTVERSENGKLTIGPTKTRSAEEAGQAIERAFDVADAVQTAAESPKEEAPKEEAPEEKPKPAAPEEKPVKDVDVRAALNQLIKAGKRDKVKEILKSFGAESFSGLKQGDYWVALSMAQEALGNG